MSTRVHAYGLVPFQWFGIGREIDNFGALDTVQNLRPCHMQLNMCRICARRLSQPHLVGDY